MRKQTAFVNTPSQGLSWAYHTCQWLGGVRLAALAGATRARVKREGGCDCFNSQTFFTHPLRLLIFRYIRLSPTEYRSRFHHVKSMCYSQLWRDSASDVAKKKPHD